MNLSGKMILPTLALCAMTVVTSNAIAAVIVDTGLPDKSSNASVNVNQFIASEFTLSGPTTIGEVQGYFGATRVETTFIRLYSDGGDLPGSILYSTSFNPVVSTGSWQGVSGLNWALTPGQFWLSFEGTQFQGAGGVYLFTKSPNPLVNSAFTATSSSGAFIPSDNIAVGIRINSAAAAVPEPASWAMMIAGFGLVGGAMRRRLRSAARVHFA